MIPCFLLIGVALASCETPVHITCLGDHLNFVKDFVETRFCCRTEPRWLQSLAYCLDNWGFGDGEGNAEVQDSSKDQPSRQAETEKGPAAPHLSSCKTTSNTIRLKMLREK
nr:hypothetical protein Iba_chr12bCG5840 [Ipomoea batatas]